MLFGRGTPESVIFAERAEHEEREVRLDAKFLEAHVLAGKRIAQQEILHGAHRQFAATEEGAAELVLEIAEHVHVGALGIDEHATGVVLDSDFSGEKSVPTVLEILARRYLPILMITPAEDSKCAIESLRSGAGNYLVKTGDYLGLIPTALGETISRGNSITELKQKITDLHGRIVDLEDKLAQALGRHFGAPIRLEIELHETVPETPARAAERIHYKNGSIPTSANWV